MLTPVHVEAVGRGGISVEMRAFQVWQVREGKVAVMRALVTEAEALEALGLRQ